MTKEPQKTSDPAVGSTRLLEIIRLFENFAAAHRQTARKCDAASLPLEQGEYWRGRAAGQSVCASVLKREISNDRGQARREESRT